MKNPAFSCGKIVSKLGVLSIFLIMSGIASAGTPPPAGVPEPGPLGLLMLGGVALLIARRFRRNK